MESEDFSDFRCHRQWKLLQLMNIAADRHSPIWPNDALNPMPDSTIDVWPSAQTENEIGRGQKEAQIKEW